MKLSFITTILLGFTALPLLAADGDASLSEQEIRAIGPLPEDKAADTVKKGDRNPFAERQVAQTIKEDGESEDAKLRTMLNTLVPSGVIKEKDGRLKVLIGRRLLAEGDRFPNMLEKQVALLRVTKVTEKAVEISWVEDQVNAQPRKVVRPVQVNVPVIEQIIPVPSADGKKGGTISVLVMPNGESLKEPAVSESSDAPPTSAVETLKSEIESSASMDLDHRPAPPSVQRTFRKR